ncbi:TRZ/ATZ family hydrolase [Oceanospirillum sediminis]|uniref:5-methylthioadenosine/S-adenosylhomocysteine deaminase n=1 Tax=Oceanospirillum sediminis TaxID=2760088 RepID=A0A839INZ0_9GAMM|nr:TRZ/ATZ family hydrolase [Oceanospirillum sediminis]MBB1485986.1 TRZ/ATZ family hydrolase [Oceanospirillum sediminis]
MPTQVDTLLHARWIIPVDPQRSVLEHHSLAIAEGRVLAILPTEQARTDYTAGHTLELTDHAIMPGLINAHGHAAMSLFRGLADDLALMTWLQEHIWPAEGQWVSPDFVRDGTRLAIAEMLKSGTTCFSDMYFYPDVCAETASELKMRAQVCCPILDFPTPWAADADEGIHKAIEVHTSFRHNPLISIAFGPHAPYTVSDEPLKKIATYQEELQIPVQMHVHETAFEVSEAEKNGARPIARLEKLGLFGPHFQAVHVTQVSDDDLKTLSDYKVSVIHCPESNLKLASGFCPVHQLQQAGINVALGTDGAASNNDLDMFGEMQVAAQLAKAVSGDAAALPAYEAIAMATINGAKALGIDKITGSLEAGKAADLIAVDMNQLETLPVYHPESQLVYTRMADKVDHVWVNGEHLVRSGMLTHIDTDQLKLKAREWGEKIRAGERND